MTKQWEQVGSIGVDAGLCWIGDPCYVLHTEKPPASIGATWGEFCDKLHTTGGESTSFPFDLGHEGLGIAVSTGWGDGSYPVYVRKENGRIAEVRFVFMGDDDPEDED